MSRSPAEHEGHDLWSRVEAAAVVELDRDLANAVAPAQRSRAARASVARIVRAAPGTWQPPQEPAMGLLLLDGFVLSRTGWEHRAAAEVLGAGDVLRPADLDDDFDPTLQLRETWSALTPARLAVIDRPWIARMAPWPEVTLELAERMLARASCDGAHGHSAGGVGSSCASGWSCGASPIALAACGQMGVYVGVPLTHQQLAELAGARRPSVSAAVSRLARAGVVRAHAKGWLLDGPPPLENDDDAPLAQLGPLEAWPSTRDRKSV